MKAPVKVKIYSHFNHDHGLPVYAKPGDSGMDVRANIDIEVRAGDTVLVPTGIHVGLPEGYEIQVRPRSGLSLKTKLRVANTPGTVDQSYTGEICIIIDNTHYDVPSYITKGERIAQLVLMEVPKIEWAPVPSVEELGTTERGAGGFGSTGTQ